MASDKQAAEPAHDLAHLVRHNKVMYEVGPARASSVSAHRTIRFTLYLYASPERPLSDASAGSPEVQGVWRELQRIAQAALPAQLLRISLSFEPPPPYLVHSRARGHRPEVVLTLSLVHDAADPAVSVAAYEAQCLGELEQNLRALGVREQRWK